MICRICHGRECVGLEDRLVIPCPACCTTAALEAVGRAAIIVRECSRVDQGELPPGLVTPALVWTRAQTRPYPAYVSMWRGMAAPLYTVTADPEDHCWRANRGAGMMAHADGSPREFDSMEQAMLACERAAAAEENPRQR